MGWLMLCCICVNGQAGGNGSPLYTPSSVRVICSLPTTRNILPDITSPDLPGCCEVLMGIRQNSTGEGGKDEVLWLWDSTCVHAQSCLVFQYRCHPDKLSCCLHSHSDPPAELYACSLPTLSPAKWKKTHTKNILKTSHSGISRWQESLPLY